MNGRRKTLLFLLPSCVVMSGIVWISVKSSAREQPQTEQVKAIRASNPMVIIDQKAWKAKDNDSGAVQELADIVFDTFTPPEVPLFAQQRIEERVIRAELNYRAGKSKSIPETNVVEMINELANKLKTPEYAKTTPLQVRVLRAGLIRDVPNLTARQNPTENSGLTDRRKTGSVAQLPEMSPLEATSVALFMLQQKMVSEDFQLNSEEFANNLNKKRKEKWQAHRSGKRDAQALKQSRLHGGTKNPKRDEMRQAVNRGAKSLNGSELTSLADTLLDTLGIER